MLPDALRASVAARRQETILAPAFLSCFHPSPSPSPGPRLLSTIADALDLVA